MPLVTVVIPTCNRPDRLARCLEGLRTLSFRADDFEVVVVDDGSRSSLESVVQPFERLLDVRLIRQENAGPAAARNTGARHATGSLLAFTDDDCVPDPDWLTELVRCHDQNPDALVGGHTVNALSNNSFAEASQSLVSYLYEYYQAKQGHPAFFTSNNMLLARDRFLAVGGFDTSFRLAAGEDRELCDRWLAAGYPLRSAPAATIRHYHGLSLRSYTRQHFNYGRGAYYFHRRRGERQENVRMEPLSFYRDLVLYPLRNGQTRRARGRVTALLALSQVVNAAGYFYEQLRVTRA